MGFALLLHILNGAAVPAVLTTAGKAFLSARVSVARDKNTKRVPVPSRAEISGKDIAEAQYG